MKAAVILIVAWLALPGAARGQSAAKPGPPPPSGTPSQTKAPAGAPRARAHIAGEVVIGELAPDFELDASNGKPLKLSSLRGDWVVLAFGPRKEDVSVLAPIVGECRTLGVLVVGVCDEKAYFLEAHHKKENLPFLLLADPTKEVSSMYGLYDAERYTVGRGFVILDRTGIVRMALLGQSIPPGDILELARFTVGRP
jgi:peroxiredoxin Q/BCP